jgi:hypothetical protein
MGGEFAQWNEWNHEKSLDWNLLDYPTHQGIKKLVSDLNAVYRREPALYELDCEPTGFEWVDCNDWQHSIVSFIRKGKTTSDVVLAVFNFTPVPREAYLVGVPVDGYWQEIFNSDAEFYGGSNMGNGGGVQAQEKEVHGRPYSLLIVVPPLGAVFFKREGHKLPPPPPKTSKEQAALPLAADDTKAQDGEQQPPTAPSVPAPKPSAPAPKPSAPAPKSSLPVAKPPLPAVKPEITVPKPTITPTNKRR